MQKQLETGPSLARKLGKFDATMIVMGGVIGSGIFMNPYVVAQRVHNPTLILLAWILGGAVALAGSFIYSELAARMPDVGGQYAYLREGIHPSLGFLYGWALLLVIQSGGMAAVALTFSRYFGELFHLSSPDWWIASITLAILTLINCFGVRAGSTTQSILMLLKIVAIVGLIFCGAFLRREAPAPETSYQHQIWTFDFFTTMAAALVPVLFAYGGWQTSGFVAGEMKNPGRDLPVGLLVGVSGVILLYLGVNLVCIYVLGATGLENTKTPASAVMQAVLGDTGAKVIAAGIAISTLGFLSQGMLTAPRVYYAMAEDRVFFRRVSWIHPRTRVPIIAIALQGLLALIIAVSGKYEQILNYVISADFLFFGCTGLALLFIRKKSSNTSVSFQSPFQPFTTIFFILISWIVVLNTFYKYPADSLIGLVLILAGIPAYFLWRYLDRAKAEKVQSL